MSLVIIGGGILLILQNKPTSGFVTILTGVGAVVFPFLYRKMRTTKTAVSGGDQ